MQLAVKAKDLALGETVINYLLSGITDDLYSEFLEEIAEEISCYYYEFAKIGTESFADINALIDEKIREYVASDKIRGLLSGLIRLKSGDLISKDSKDHTESQLTLSDKIVSYSKASLYLFKALFEKGVAVGWRETLISAYARILDYCRSAALNDNTALKCVERVSELKKIKDITGNEDNSEEGERTLKSLKVYLGQALPDTGRYDVFISHKSADDRIADRVYEYLKQCGYEVFCDHYTLGELRDENYDKRVREALENSKHFVLIASNSDYLKSGWVQSEWKSFHTEKLEGRKNGNLLMILSDELLSHKEELPPELRVGLEIVRTSEFREKLTKYLW